MNVVRTVLGDRDPASLGRVNYHEHLFQVSPLLVGDDLVDEACSQEEARSLAASGFETMIDATPIGLGRNAGALARISNATGLTIIATTGTHREAHYADDHWMRDTSVPERARLFLNDLTLGIPQCDGPGEAGLAAGPTGSRVRAGLLKVGIGYWSITNFERKTLQAVALAQLATGAPVMVHLEFCTAAHEVLNLFAAAGVPANRIALAHADRDPNPALHLELAERGAFLGYDGMARPRTRSDAELIDLTEQVVAGGAGKQILIGGDVARRTRYRAYGGLPGLAYLGECYLPLLSARVGVAAIDDMLVHAPRRFLAWS